MEVTPAVDRSKDRPVYKQVADQMRERLDAGDFDVGDRLPSLGQLTREYGVSRSTVREGLAILINEGRIDEVQGRFLVREPRPRRFIIHRDPRTVLRASHGPDRASVQTDVEAQGFEFHQAVDGFPREVPAAPRIARALQVDVGDRVFVRPRVIRVRELGGLEWRRVTIADSYYPVDLVAPHMRQRENSGSRGLHGGIADAGHPPARFMEQTSFRMPRPDETDRLDVGAGTPVIERFRAAFDDDDRPVECVIAVSAGDVYVLEYRVDA